MADVTVPNNLQDQIEEVRDMDINYDILHPKANIYDVQSNRNIIIPFHSYANKYRDYLSSIIISEKLSEEDKRKYHYRPKTVSLDKYGTTELWSDILILNDCFNISQFTPDVLKYYDPDEYKDYLNNILIIEGVNS